MFQGRRVPQTARVCLALPGVEEPQNREEEHRGQIANQGDGALGPGVVQTEYAAGGDEALHVVHVAVEGVDPGEEEQQQAAGEEGFDDHPGNAGSGGGASRSPVN